VERAGIKMQTGAGFGVEFAKVDTGMITVIARVDA
jgi:hypothetical protein